MIASPDDRHFVYRIYGHDGDLLYIGATSKFDARMTEYETRPEVAAWGRDEYPTRAAAFAAEKAAIREHQPIWNIQNKGYVA